MSPFYYALPKMFKALLEAANLKYLFGYKLK